MSSFSTFKVTEVYFQCGIEARPVWMCDFRWVLGHDLAEGHSWGPTGQSWLVTHWCMSSSFFAPSPSQHREAGVLISATWSVCRMDKNSLEDWAGSETPLQWKLNWLWKGSSNVLHHGKWTKVFSRSNVLNAVLQLAILSRRMETAYPTIRYLLAWNGDLLPPRYSKITG